MLHYADLYMKVNSPIQETQKKQMAFQTIILTKLASLTRNDFTSRKLLDFGYESQSADEQTSDIREPSDFRLQH